MENRFIATGGIFGYLHAHAEEASKKLTPCPNGCLTTKGSCMCGETHPYDEANSKVIVHHLTLMPEIEMNPFAK
ncbi:hypothetical protein OAT16_02275 [Prolixibacteraceae bacterium]|nr:hypothetical protein [Prolixibacteraceae bacterium]